MIVLIGKANRSYLELLLKYGKNSLATLAGANLLRSSDQLLIGFFMGSASAGLYSIMIKILDIVDIPVRALLTTAFPVLSKSYSEKDQSRFENKFYESFKLSYLLSVPASLALLIFPDLIIQLLADDSFQAAIPLVRIAGVIVLIGPLEKLLGLSLDSTNRPQLNARKVWLMVTLNIIGDLLAVAILSSVEGVAIVTIINLLLGITYSYGRLSFMRFRFQKLSFKNSPN
jgi:O-antigen/teichoic acid export membrane protein